MAFSDTYNDRFRIWRKAEKQIGTGFTTPVRKKRHSVKIEKSSKKSKNEYRKKPYREPT